MMNRLTSRERALIFLVAAVLFAVGNWALLTSLKNRHARLKADLVQKQAEIQSMKLLLAESEQSASRQAWLSAKQPRLTNPEQTRVQLLEQIKEAARANDVLLESPELGDLEVQGAYRSVSVQVATKSSWASLVKFLHAMQQPDRFIVFETATVQIDPGNASRMSCKFKIAKWYAF
ncbi:MAG: GspMb/PilO family protein [Verrucomicrobia bacterium]|nr:GspMb/PilO family protein [Verrucomicrobiota bacterium]